MAQDSHNEPWDMPLTEGEKYLKDGVESWQNEDGGKQIIIDKRNWSAYVEGYSVPVKQ